MRGPVSRPNYIAWQEERCMKRKLIFVINLLVSGSPQLEYSVQSITRERGSTPEVEQEPRYDNVLRLSETSERRDPTKKAFERHKWYTIDDGKYRSCVDKVCGFGYISLNEVIARV